MAFRFFPIGTNETTNSLLVNTLSLLRDTQVRPRRPPRTFWWTQYATPEELWGDDTQTTVVQATWTAE